MNGDSYGKGTTERRRNLVVSILKRSPASVIFCQEVQSSAKLAKKVVEECGSDVYEFAFTGKESAVMWRKSDFDGDRRSLRGTDSSIIEIVVRLQRTNSDVDVSEVRTRTAMVKLTSRKTGASFLAVSWHGPWSGKDKNDKLMKFEGLICFLIKVCTCEKVKLSSFIIGGDFNLDTSKTEPSEVEKKHGVTISRYKLRKRDKEQRGVPFVPFKDTFIASVPSDKLPMTGGIRVFRVKPSEFEPYESSENELLDHVPVVGVLRLDKLVSPYKEPSMKQDKGKLERYFHLYTFVYIIKLSLCSNYLQGGC